MRIRNKGTKIVNIGTVVLMPDQTETVADTLAENPAIKVLMNLGFLEEVKGEEVPAKEVKAEEKAEEPVKEEAEAEVKTEAKAEEELVKKPVKKATKKSE